MLTWLERYIMLERVLVDLDASGEHQISEAMTDGLEVVWEHLSQEDLEYLWSRADGVNEKGTPILKSDTSLDRIPLPRHMLWRPHYDL